MGTRFFLLCRNQVDPLACDVHGYTPLMWACANGHRDVVALLAQWDSSALNIADRNGKTVAAVARQRGHNAMAEELESRKILSARGRSAGEYHSAITLSLCPSTAESATTLTTTTTVAASNRFPLVDFQTFLCVNFSEPFPFSPLTTVASCVVSNPSRYFLFFAPSDSFYYWRHYILKFFRCYCVLYLRVLPGFYRVLKD